jgi:FkbM family methyltransferase
VSTPVEETFVPHVGWLAHEPGDDVGRYLREGWFEFAEQALWWLYLRPGDCVIDCGAHVGLFTLLAARAVGGSGRVIALEPNPATAQLLRQNAERAGASNVRVVEAAATAVTGEITLHAGAGAHAAYSSAVGAVRDSRDVRVPATTIDDLLRERGVERVAMLKIDVEGAEADVWKGCAASLARHRIEAAMIEFTEANQQAANSSSDALARAIEAGGLRLQRLASDAASDAGADLALLPASVNGPIEYENLFAARDLQTISHRLHTADAERRRIAADVLARGRSAFGMLKRACDTDHLQGIVSDLKQTMADLQQRLDQAIVRGEVAEQEVTLLRQRLRAYATFIQQTVRSRPMRLTYALRLSQPPQFGAQLAADANVAADTDAADGR